MTFPCEIRASSVSKTTNNYVDYSLDDTLRSFLLLLFAFSYWMLLVIEAIACVSSSVTIATTTIAFGSIVFAVVIISAHKVVQAPLLNELFNFVLQNYALFSIVAIVLMVSALFAMVSLVVRA